MLCPQPHMTAKSESIARQGMFTCPIGAIGPFESAAREVPLGLHVANFRLDRAAPSELRFQPIRQPAAHAGYQNSGLCDAVSALATIDDGDKAERLLRNLTRRLELEAPSVSKSILEGLDEILTVTRLGLPPELRRSLASTNIVESMNAVIRQVCRNVKCWRDAKMALRWTAAGMIEAAKCFRRLKAHKQLPVLKAALEKHRSKPEGAVDQVADAA